MMSEELFILCQDDFGNYEIRYDEEVFHFLWEVAPILNEQQAIIHRDELSIKTMMSNMEKLEEENEQLRQFITKGRRLSVKELMDNVNENESLKKKIKKLEKENEQLQKDKERLKERLRECGMRLDRFNCM